MERPNTPDEAIALYEAAIAANGPFTRGTPLRIKGHEGPYIKTEDGRKILDLDGHIFAQYMCNPQINERVCDVLKEIGTAILAPKMTHPEVDLAKVRIAKCLDDEFGGGPWEVDLQSSGTRANEDALTVGRAVLGGEQRLAVFKEGYHGSGGLRDIIGHSSWKSRGSLPFGIPVTFLDFEDTDEGRDYTDDFGRFLECNVGADTRIHQLGEWGMQGVAGFEKVRPLSLREIAREVHRRGGFVTGDIVQPCPFRTGEGILAPYGVVDKNDPMTIPDSVTGGKGMGFVGHPLAFVAFRKKSLEGTDPKHFGKSYDTNGRNVLAAAAFNAGYEILMDPKFQADVRTEMIHWQEGLRDIQTRHGDRVKRVTGIGYMSGLELDSAKRVTDFLKVGAAETGITCCVGGINGNKLRLGVKLDSPREIIDEALTKIEDTLCKT